MQDKTLRNTLLSIMATVIMAMIAGWVQINNRISVLEVQVKNDRELMLQTTSENESNIKEIKVLQQQILVGIQHLQDVKQDKPNE